MQNYIMNKIVRNGLILSLILLSSCELSMEEYLVSEEDKGKEEPWTEVCEYGEITYQYQDDVTPLNGEPQNYIAMMNDSVIWFMDNIPNKWVPKEDHYIVANCSQTIPLGICSKVRSVTRDAGMIRVEHEPTDKENVFKTLEMRLDFNYTVPGVSDFVEDGTEATRSTPSINRPGFWKTTPYLSICRYISPVHAPMADMRTRQNFRPASLLTSPTRKFYMLTLLMNLRRWLMFINMKTSKKNIKKNGTTLIPNVILRF